MRLGNFYVYDFDMLGLTDNNYDVELDKLLTTYYNGTYDVTEIMKTLTPQCSMMLLKCKLHGKYTNCSTLFKFRKTPDGYCCTFNYVRESDDIPEQNDETELSKPEQVWDLGIERGLTVVMDPLLDDYFYSILPIKGWKVIVFNPTDYPDMTSGGVTEVLAVPLSETFLDVIGTIFISNPGIKNFPRNKRNCIFPDEGKLLSRIMIYTYSDCIVNCKINFIQKSCGCRPFFYPRHGIKDCDIGGICGVFIGFSFITIVELLYFFVLMFRDLFCKKSALQKDDDRKTEIPSDRTQTTGTIYWNELQPRSWHSAKYGKFFANRVRY
ncbi:PPK28 protein, partial [Acromyrmex heyeri]